MLRVCQDNCTDRVSAQQVGACLRLLACHVQPLIVCLITIFFLSLILESIAHVLKVCSGFLTLFLCWTCTYTYNDGIHTEAEWADLTFGKRNITCCSIPFEDFHMIDNCEVPVLETPTEFRLWQWIPDTCHQSIILCTAIPERPACLVTWATHLRTRNQGLKASHSSHRISLLIRINSHHQPTSVWNNIPTLYFMLLPHTKHPRGGAYLHHRWCK
jgi:hypothetical protein